MKTLTLTAVLVAAATLTFAQKPFATDDSEKTLKKSDIEVAVLKRSNDEVSLLMEKAPREKVRISVYEGKTMLYSKRIKKEATANITYDISAFPVGTYTFEVEKDGLVVYSADIRKSSEALADNK